MSISVRLRARRFFETSKAIPRGPAESFGVEIIGMIIQQALHEYSSVKSMAGGVAASVSRWQVEALEFSVEIDRIRVGHAGDEVGDLQETDVGVGVGGAAVAEELLGQ